MWQRLFAYDEVHLSPHGTFLMACILHYTLYGHTPRASVDMVDLWQKTRFRQPYHNLPIPNRDEASYLYGMADCVMAKGHRPKSFILYQNGQAVDFEEGDGEYTQDRQRFVNSMMYTHSETGEPTTNDLGERG